MSSFGGSIAATAIDLSSASMLQHPLLALEQLASQCTELCELQHMGKQLCRRLAAFVTYLETQEQRRSSPTSRYTTTTSNSSNDTSWSVRADPLIARFTNFVQRNAQHNTVQRLADMHRLRELFDLYSTLDAAFRHSSSEHADPARTWQLTWASDAARAEQQLEHRALDCSTLQRELGASPDAQREALALVTFAAETRTLSTNASNNSDNNERAAYDAERLRVLTRVFRLLVTAVATVDVPHVPTWFISSNDVAVRSTSRYSTPRVDVRLADWLPVHTTVLVKRLLASSSSSLTQQAQRDAVVHEAQLAYALRHANLLELVGGCAVASPPFVVYESTLGDDAQTLDALVSAVDRTTTAVVRSRVLDVLVQVAQALQYLHETHALVHGDVRCANVLVSTDGRAKLCSFHAAGTATNDGQALTTAAASRVLHALGPLRWAAPETLQATTEVSLAADVYSFGMCIYEALSRSHDVPFGFAADATVRTRILTGDLPDEWNDDDLNNTNDDSVKQLVKTMCALDPNDRPAIRAVVTTLTELADHALQQLHTDAAAVGASTDVEPQQPVAATDAPGAYADAYRQRLIEQQHAFPSRSSIDTIDTIDSVVMPSVPLPPPASQSDVTLQLKWLGIKINSIGAKIVVSKFLRSAAGAMGEIEATGRVAMGDVMVAINRQRVCGLNRHDVGAWIQRTPRPLTLTFERDVGLLDDAMRFSGLRIDARWRDRGSFVALPGALERVIGAATSAFTLELWFALADVEDAFVGGVLLGAQDVAAASEDASAWPYVHKQLIVVDSRGNLCVTWLERDSNHTPALVARELTPNIWYHLVITYSGNSASGSSSSRNSSSSLGSNGDMDPQQQLTVYLDGEMRLTAQGPLMREWSRLTHVNVGTGCISGVVAAKPTPDFAGWYGFNGLVHEGQIWRNTAMTDVDVQMLFRGARDCVATSNYALRRDAQRRTQHATSAATFPERVRASRPQHVVAQVY